MRYQTEIWWSPALERLVAVEVDTKTQDEFLLRPSKHWYALGKTPPHYPVPAVQCKAFFHPHHVNVVKYNGRVGMFGPGYETIAIWVDEPCHFRYSARNYPL